MQTNFIFFCLALAINITLQDDSGRNDGEPDYDPEDANLLPDDIGTRSKPIEDGMRHAEQNENEHGYDVTNVLMAMRDAGRNDGEPDYDEPNDTESREIQRQLGSSCNGIPSTDWSCCTPWSKCSAGRGDCDRDSDCASGLRCGTNNCRPGVTGSNWSPAADCCEVAEPKTCNGVPSTDWSCCTSANKCNVGEGDCDRDSDCASGLICGTDKCSPGVTGSNWHRFADCCRGTHIFHTLS